MIKNFFTQKIFHKLKNKKVSFLLFFCTTLLGLFLPLHSAKAIAPLIILGAVAGVGMIGALVNSQVMFASVANVAIAIATTFLQIPLTATNAFLSAAIGILAITTSPNFISLSYTQPTGNPLLQIGWTLTRDLTNMGFVIAMVIIGLATALRIGEYQWQKTLPTLIAIMLLINFTPVIMGVVVDASNIVMQFFLGDMINLDFVGNLWTQQLDTAKSALEIVGSNINGDVLGRTFALIFFGFIAGIMILAFAFLFILRYVAIWMLVIISPFAFFAYIFPSTRGFFKTWWSKFIHWCIIGITAAFFLYLTQHLMRLAPNMINPQVQNGTSSNMAGLINSLLPFGAAIAFMIIGFFTALSSSAMGSSGIISFAQKQTKSLSSGAWKKMGIGKKISDRARKSWEESSRAKGFRDKMTDWSKMSSFSNWGAGQSGLGGFAKRAIGKTATIATLGQGAGVVRATARALGPEDLEKAKKKIDTAEAEVDKAVVDTVISKFRNAGDWATKIGYLNRLAKKGHMDEAISKGLKAEEISDTLRMARGYKQEQDIVSALPELDEERLRASVGLSSSTVLPVATMTPRQRDALKNAYKSEIFSKMKPARAGQISKNVSSNALIMESLIESWTGSHVAEFVQSKGADGIDAIENAIRASGGMPALRTSNPKLHKYLTGTPAQNLGFTIF